MRFLRGLLLFLGSLVALFFAVGLFLPKSAQVERSIATAASLATVFGIVNGFRRFNEWSPWAGLDPQTRYTYGGPESGVGTRITWTLDSDFSDSIVGRYFGLMLDRMVGPDYEKGLAQLKTIAEATAAAAAPEAQPAGAGSPTGQDTPVPPRPQ